LLSLCVQASNDVAELDRLSYLSAGQSCVQDNEQAVMNMPVMNELIT